MFEREIDRLQTTLSDEDRQETHAEICRIAVAKLEQLPAVLESFDVATDEDSLRYGALVEALASEAGRFESVLLRELDRITRLCEARPAASTLWALGAFQFLEASRDPSFKSALLERYIDMLQSPRQEVRAVAIDMLGGFTISSNPEAREGLLACLEDSSWKVQARAAWLLEDENLLPSGYSPSLGDRIRRALFTWQ